MLTVSLLISIVFLKIASEIMWDEKRKMHFCVIFPLKRHKYHSIRKKKCIHFLHNNDITLSTSPLKLSALRKFNCIIHKKSRIQVHFLLLWNMFYKIAEFYEKNLEFSRLFIFLILRQNEQVNTLINNVPIPLLTFVTIFGPLNYYCFDRDPVVTINDDAKSVGSTNGLS